MHISKDCSELCCTECNTKLHKTFQTIQLFREANSFWQKLLIIKSEPIEEVKHEQPEYIDNENELIEYLNNTVDDVIFVDEPISVMDDFTDFEFFKVKEPKENPINHYPIKVVEDSPQTLKPAIKYIKTTAEPIETTSFDCKTCKKGTNIKYAYKFNYLYKIFTSMSSVQNCQGAGRTQESNSRINECILRYLRQKHVNSIWSAKAHATLAR